MSVAPAERKRKAVVWLVRAVFALTGLGTLAPVVAAFAPERFASLYGVSVPADALLPLMRHRQVLLGILGAALVAAAFVPRLRVPVLVAALTSKLAFVALVAAATVTTQIRQVALGDSAAIVLLLACAALERGHKPRTAPPGGPPAEEGR